MYNWRRSKLRDRLIRLGRRHGIETLPIEERDIVQPCSVCPKKRNRGGRHCVCRVGTASCEADTAYPRVNPGRCSSAKAA